MYNFVQVMPMLSFIYSINNSPTTLESCKLEDMQPQIRGNQRIKAIS